jgi:hypothetical protein
MSRNNPQKQFAGNQRQTVVNGISACISPSAMPSRFDDPQTYAIIGAAIAVHRGLGCGFLEAVSREAFTVELKEQAYRSSGRHAFRYGIGTASCRTRGLLLNFGAPSLQHKRIVLGLTADPARPA